MQQIINFIIRNKTFLLFLLLFTISILFTVQTHSYHKSKFINSANFLTGGLYNSANSVSQYFNLKEKNKVLAKENQRLKQILYNSTTSIDSVYIDSTKYKNQYKLTTAIAVKNSYSNTNNTLTINKGKNQGIKQDFGVITSKGIIGIIDNTSNNYATVISILNTKSRINAQLKNSSHYGSLEWDAKSIEFVQLIDIQKTATIKIGDTIITGGKSYAFPKGIPIGNIHSFNLDKAEDYYEIKVKLFNDMSNIGHVYVIENLDLDEISTLENVKDE